MASYLLYVITGVVLVFMAARNLFQLRHNQANRKSHAQRVDIVHSIEAKGLALAETAASAAILLFGLWLTFAAAFLLMANLVHS